MSEDKSYERTARSEAAAARRVAYESGEIVGSRAMVDGPEERRSRWDTDLTTTTTPQSAIDNWGAPASPAPVQSETGDPSGAGSSEATTGATPEK
jgi:hypothetical protein